MTSKRLALSLIEVLVVIGIVAILMAILLPAVQHARESARRATCQNNLRQAALAVQAFHESQGRVPSLYHGSYTYEDVTLSQPRSFWEEWHFHSWQTAILPNLEQSALYARIDLTRAASDPSNQENANVELSLFVCPSASSPTQSVQILAPDRAEGTAARTDYESIGGVYLFSDKTDVDGASMAIFTHAAPGVWGLPRKNLRFRAEDRSSGGGDPVYDGTDETNLRQVADGLSNTIMVGEIAGRPDIYANGGLEEVHDSWGGINNRPAWALSGSYGAILLTKEKRVNETNRGGLYSFHPGGAHAALADGSIRFIDEATDPHVIAAMATRAGGESETEN
jgi:type II secretory pathway pseudopilin PulG